MQHFRLEGLYHGPNKSRTSPLDGLREQIQNTVYQLVCFLLALGLVVDQGENHPQMCQPKNRRKELPQFCTEAWFCDGLAEDPHALRALTLRTFSKDGKRMLRLARVSKQRP